MGTNQNTITLSAQIAAGRSIGQKTVRNHQIVAAQLLGQPPFPGTLNLVLSQPVELRHGQAYDTQQASKQA